MFIVRNINRVKHLLYKRYFEKDVQNQSFALTVPQSAQLQPAIKRFNPEINCRKSTRTTAEMSHRSIHRCDGDVAVF